METRKFKVGVDAPVYCKPCHLLAVLADIKLHVGQLHTLVAAASMRSIRFPQHHRRFAVIWVKRCTREYKLTLARYSY